MINEYKIGIMKKYFYPDIKIDDILIKDGNVLTNSFKIETIVRKKCNGVWYLYKIYKKHLFSESFDKSKLIEINNFHMEVYFFIILGKVSSNNPTIDGKVCFEKDDNQENESERIREIYSL